MSRKIALTGDDFRKKSIRRKSGYSFLYNEQKRLKAKVDLSELNTRQRKAIEYIKKMVRSSIENIGK